MLIRSSRGAALFEFALVALILAALFFAFMDLSRIIAIKMVLLKGAHEGLAIAQ